MEYNFSRAAHNMRSSAIRNILSLAVRPDIISFAGGMPGDELFPTNDLRELVATLTEKQVQEAMQYGPTSGYPPLLEALKEWLRAKGFPVDTNRLIITTGSLQAINIIGKIFINPGDVVLTEDPVFIGATSAYKSFEAELKGVPMDADGTAEVCLDSIPLVICQAEAAALFSVSDTALHLLQLYVFLIHLRLFHLHHLALRLLP